MVNEKFTYPQDTPAFTALSTPLTITATPIYSALTYVGYSTDYKI